MGEQQPEMKKPADVLIIGGGAAGFFAAAELGRLSPGIRILMLEKTGKVLSKVKISGGGRCNVTHHCFDPQKLLEFYPRGNPWLKLVFAQFSVKDTLAWFEKEGVTIKAEADGRMFPITNNSQTIVDALSRAAHRNPGFRLQLHCPISAIQPLENRGYLVSTSDGDFEAKTVILACGGQPSLSGFAFLQGLKLPFVSPVPSLFTFNTKPHPWPDLQGISVPEVWVSLQGSPFHFTGPILVTHWGFSGPAVLKLSAFAARYLAEKNYQYRFTIDFLPQIENEKVWANLNAFAQSNPKKKPISDPVFPLPKKLWVQLCQDAGLDRYHNWAETGKKALLAMAEVLKNRQFEAFGKTTYKEEFVTSGGIALDAVETKTCQLKNHPGLFAAGEILDVDGITGGFNFQAAWSTAAICAQAIISGRET